VTVRTRVLLIVVATSVVTICTLYAALHHFSLSRFLALEDLQAKDTAMAVRAELGEEIERLDRSNFDLSVYDDTYFNMPRSQKNTCMPCSATTKWIGWSR
jgi:sensor domain CHASE-containing protein